MKRVHVLGGSRNANFLESLFDEISSDWGYSNSFPDEKTPRPDLLLFTGGQDLCPSIYKKDYPFITGDEKRDEWEHNWFIWAVRNKVPMFGICRGMQLFTALTGGKLIPDVGHHYGHHDVFTNVGNKFNVNSIHHQMCVPSPSTKMLAWAENRAFEGVPEPEALWFPKVKALGVQWHPEMMGQNTEATKFVLDHIQEKLL